MRYLCGTCAELMRYLCGTIYGVTHVRFMYGSCTLPLFNNHNTQTTNILTKNRSFFCEKVKNPAKKTGYFKPILKVFCNSL